MSEALIRAQIKTILEGVSGIGEVHDYERLSLSLAEYLELMTTGTGASKKVNGWTIHRESTLTQISSFQTYMRNHNFRIHGIYEVNDDDASEKTFQGIVDAIFTEFLANLDLNGTALEADPINIESVDVDEFAGRAFHTAELSLSVREEVS